MAFRAPALSTDRSCAAKVGDLPKIARAAATTRGTSAAPWAVRTRRIVPPKVPIVLEYFRVNAGVRTSTPPDAPRSPRSSGRRTMPTTRSRRCGPAGGPPSRPRSNMATCCGL